MARNAKKHDQPDHEQPELHEQHQQKGNGRAEPDGENKASQNKQ